MINDNFCFIRFMFAIRHNIYEGIPNLDFDVQNTFIKDSSLGFSKFYLWIWSLKFNFIRILPSFVILS